MKYLFTVAPIGKPRMTRSDRWRQRPAVLRYFAFKDELRALAQTYNFVPTDDMKVTFGIPMPKSYGKAKRQFLLGQRHTLKPDVDNLIKSFLDALLDDDSGISSVCIKKVWSDEGYIEVEKIG